MVYLTSCIWLVNRRRPLRRYLYGVEDKQKLQSGYRKLISHSWMLSRCSLWRFRHIAALFLSELRNSSTLVTPILWGLLATTPTCLSVSSSCKKVLVNRRRRRRYVYLNVQLALFGKKVQAPGQQPMAFFSYIETISYVLCIACEIQSVSRLFYRLGRVLAVSHLLNPDKFRFLSYFIAFRAL